MVYGTVYVMRSESALASYFASQVIKHGGISWQLVPLQAGIPDRMVLWPGGRIDLVELKQEAGRLAPVQRLWHERASRLGTHVTVLYGKAQVDSWIASR